MITKEKLMLSLMTMFILLLSMSLNSYGELSKTLEIGILNVEFDYPQKVNKLNQNPARNHYAPYEKCVAHIWNESGRVDLTNYLKGDWEGALSVAEEALEWSINGESQESSILEYDEPSANDMEKYEVEVKFKDKTEVLDRLILVIVPRETNEGFEAWYNGESNDTGWLQELPALYSNIDLQDNAPVDPEPDTCENWKKPDDINNFYHPGAAFEIRSEETPGGHGHQACYSNTGLLLTSGISAGSADRSHYSNYTGNDSHTNRDVNPFVWAAQLDGNPVEKNFLGTNLTAPMLYQGDNLNRYLEVRPPIANNRERLDSGECPE